MGVLEVLKLLVTHPDELKVRPFTGCVGDTVL